MCATATMGKKNTGVNTKVAAAKEHQAQLAGAKAAKARATEEAAEAREWAKGSNQRGSKREEDAARKQEEKAAKISAKKALEVAEAKELTGFKSVVVGRNATSAVSRTSRALKRRQHTSTRYATAMNVLLSRVLMCRNVPWTTCVPGAQKLLSRLM